MPKSDNLPASQASFRSGVQKPELSPTAIKWPTVFSTLFDLDTAACLLMSKVIDFGKCHKLSKADSRTQISWKPLLPSNGTGKACAVNENGTNRLESWKEIALFIGREVRTAMRWAKSQRMPVH